MPSHVSFHYASWLASQRRLATHWLPALSKGCDGERGSRASFKIWNLGRGSDALLKGGEGCQGWSGSSALATFLWSDTTNGCVKGHISHLGSPWHITDPKLSPILLHLTPLRPSQLPTVTDEFAQALMPLQGHWRSIREAGEMTGLLPGSFLEDVF